MGDPSEMYTDLSEQSASRERAIREHSDGTFKRRQDQVVDFAYRHGTIGITFKDCNELDMHHGESSGALSSLHKQGKLFRLTKYRKPGQPRCSVYIHPEYAGAFAEDEIARTPGESKMQRLVREAEDKERYIARLIDENNILRRRLWIRGVDVDEIQ